MTSAFLPEFRFQGSPALVRFGPGIRHETADAVAELGRTRAAVLTTPEQAAAGEALLAALGARGATLHSGAVMHTPTDATARAVAAIEAARADCLVALGGGSTIGLAKAIALRTGLPQIAIPTTYAGSEATPILGQTENGVKTTLTDPRVRPDVILYDAELVATLPPGLTATSALNAIAHAAEALYARDRNPISTLLALEGIRAFAAALPRVLAEPSDLAARGETLYGAWLCGTVLGQVGMALHHKLCHTLGGSFGLPHAETHAIVLPHAVAYNERAVPDLLRPAAEALGAPDAATGLAALADRIGAPRRLRDLGLTEADLPRAADIATERPYWNPAPITRDGILELLSRAW